MGLTDKFIKGCNAITNTGKAIILAGLVSPLFMADEDPAQKAEAPHSAGIGAGSYPAFKMMTPPVVDASTAFRVPTFTAPKKIALPQKIVSPAADLGSAILSLPPSNEEEPSYYNEYYNQLKLDQCNTQAVAWAEAKAKAPQKHQWAYDIAEESLHYGITPVAALLFMSIEVGLNEKSTRDYWKSAQGPLQGQPGWLIANVRLYAADTPYYKSLEEGDSTKIAIDTILEAQPSSFKAMKSGMNSAHRSRNSKHPYWNMSELRYNYKFMGQIMGAQFAAEHPALKVENLPQDPNQAMQVILKETFSSYQSHFRGPSNQLYPALLARIPNTQIRESAIISNAVHQVRNLTGARTWLDTGSLVQAAHANKGFFPHGTRTTFKQHQDAMWRKFMESANARVLPYVTASSEQCPTFREYIAQRDAERGLTKPLVMAVATSHRPSSRPDSFASMSFTVKASFNTAAPMFSLQPKARPEGLVTTQPDPIIKRDSGVVEISVRPRLRPQNALLAS